MLENAKAVKDTTAGHIANQAFSQYHGSGRYVDCFVCTQEDFASCRYLVSSNEAPSSRSPFLPS